MGFVNDTFTAADGTNLSAHTGETGATWTANTSNAVVASGRVRPTATLFNSLTASGTPASADYDVEADVYYAGAAAGGGAAGVTGRASGKTYYMARYDTTGWQLYYVSNESTFTQIGSTFTQALTVGQSYRLKLEMRGTAIKLYVDGVERCSGTNGTLTAAGKAGVHFYASASSVSDSAGWHLDNFEATDAGGDTTPPTLSGAATDSAGTQITATLSESGCVADGGGSSGSGGFTLSGTSATVSGWSISGATLTLTLSGAVTNGQTVTYSYARASTTDDIRDAASNYLADFSGASVTNNTADTTAPVLTSPVGTQTGTTTATIGATTDEGNGTLYGVVTTSPTAPSAAQVEAGQDHAGAAAAFAGGTAVASTGAKTISATGLTAATAYYAHLMHEDAAGNDSNVVTSAQFTTAAGPTTALVTDANWFFSPYNWLKSGSSYAQATSGGAYFRTKFTGTSCKLNVDIPATSTPCVLYSVDDGAWTRADLTSASTQVTLATGLADATHTLTVVLDAFHTGIDRWTTPTGRIRVTGLELDPGDALAAPDLQPGRMILFADSNGEGVDATGAGLAGTVASRAFPLIVGRALGCEVGVVAFAGQGFTTNVVAVSNVPDLEDAWDEHHSGQTRLAGGLFDPAPDWIVCTEGQNDSNGSQVQTAAGNLIAAWRAAAPSARIVFVAPANLNLASSIQAAVTAAADANCKYVTTGYNWLNDASGTDAFSISNHLSAAYGHPLYGATAAAEVREAFGGASGPVPMIGSPLIRSLQ